jgi:predicted Abi (CAAX) family protease
VLAASDIVLWHTVVERIGSSFSTVPTLLQWGETALWLIVFAIIAIPIGMKTRLLHYKPATGSWKELAAATVIALFAPSLLEEFIFRALLLPHPSEAMSAAGQVLSVVAADVLFVLGHVVVGWLFVPSARPLFYNRSFLALSAVFGLVASVVYLRTGSIWPCVVLHWGVVVAWMVWFDGWIMALGPPQPLTPVEKQPPVN